MKKLAILPGSYDPMTLGHLAIVEKAERMYEHLVVAVMVNPEKQTLFTPEERVEIAGRTLENHKTVEVLFDGGLLIDLYKKLGADAVVKGYRNDTDFAYEQKMAEWNKAHLPEFETVLLRADDVDKNISSTEVRRRLENGESLAGLVAESALPLVEKKRHSL